MPSIHEQSLTPGLRRLLAPDALVGPVGSLAATEMDMLLAVARGDPGFSAAISRHQAIAALPAFAPAQVALAILDQVSGNRSTRRTDRVTAVRGLGRMATPAAQDLLLDRIVDADPRVQQAAFAALGHFADPSALAVLERVTAADAASEQQLALTQALIAHRYGLAGPFLGDTLPRTGTAPDRTTPVTLALKSVEATTADLSRFRGSMYGIQLAERAFDLRCGRAEWTIFCNRSLGSALTAASQLLERPCIAALIARWLPPGIAATTQYVVLSRPIGRSVKIDVVRADGDVMYTGAAEPAGPELSFAITDVDRPGTAPTDLAGRLGANGVRLEVALVSDARIAPHPTLPVRIDSPRV
jgi:hypothetical protein